VESERPKDVDKKDGSRSPVTGAQRQRTEEPDEVGKASVDLQFTISGVPITYTREETSVSSLFLPIENADRYRMQRSSREKAGTRVSLYNVPSF
jgi:hypothetical protein